jgi:periplasmic divalent cation tolerance protein
LLYKTTAERYPELEAHIKQVHDYDTPEIIATRSHTAVTPTSRG